MMASRKRGAARDRILAAADELFYYDGIAATGIDAVVDRANVALGSMYNHFESKDALVVAYLQRRDQQWRATWESTIADCVTPYERILAIYDALERWVSERGAEQGCAHVAALVQLPPNHPGVSVAYRHKAYIRDRLTELVRDGGYSRPGEIAGDLTVLYEGLLANMLVTQQPSAVAGARRMAAARLAGRAASAV
ncbi:TetR/AcrR family transcriptional regulator [Actinopolyspora mortivallis]|uniref:TetR/AcrR family transcriptional regulator n=1 Tax=Actinopolyspora mortivallis TaxID=33906 RepID=UPI0003773B53|nr:TetR/AcrR family transcriptional regulator [Actinopolyspora mortivallis]